MTQSKIEWTEQVWNPLVGCTVHSPGCTNCYAMRDAWRKQFNPNAKIAAKYAGTVEKTKGGQLLWTGRVNFSEEALLAPLRRRVPTRYFVNSMSDLFHAQVPDETIDRIFAVMALCPQHTFQVLTKRSDRMREYLSDPKMHFRVAMTWENRLAQAHSVETLCRALPLPNVWLGVSVEDQARADLRIPDLLATPAAVRWISAEPLLGPVALADFCTGHYFTNALTGARWHDAPEGVSAAADMGGAKLDWVVCGGESGPDARPMHPDWARALRDQCASAGVPFFFKQWGEWAPTTNLAPKATHWLSRFGRLYGRDDPAAEGRGINRPGKKAAGRLLDGVLHDGFPA